MQTSKQQATKLRKVTHTFIKNMLNSFLSKSSYSRFIKQWSKDFSNGIGSYWQGKQQNLDSPVSIPFVNKETLHSIFPLDLITSTKDIDAAMSSLRNIHQENPPSSFERRQWLRDIVSAIQARKEEFVCALVLETGKPLAVAEIEVDRTLDTLSISSEYPERTQKGITIPLDNTPRNAMYSMETKRFPIGIINMITPFNFPLNLAAHKIGPAIASGNPFILKPAPKTPLTAALLAQIFQKVLPDDFWSVVNIADEQLDYYSCHGTPAMISFTGSAPVGWSLRKKIPPNTKLALELGGNASCIIDENIGQLSLDYIAKRIAFGAFYQQGQSCVSVQRVFCHKSNARELSKHLIKHTNLWINSYGPVFDSGTQVGPMIDPSQVERVHSQVTKSLKNGATILAGGTKLSETAYSPTIVAGDVSCFENTQLGDDEIFGPVFTFDTFSSLPPVLDLINSSPFGLQAGIFSDSVASIDSAFEKLAVGGLVVNDIPSARVDSMPYGGIKMSGIGREGISSAIEEMTELKLKLICRPQ